MSELNRAVIEAATYAHRSFFAEGGWYYCGQCADCLGSAETHDGEELFADHQASVVWGLIKQAEPAVVTTAEELDALPNMSVVLDIDGDVWQKRGDWTLSGDDRCSINALYASLPATVLYIGS